MTYGYENLGAERFQELCQALLSVEHPELQCLPVGQPDGGRDAFAPTAVPRRSRAGAVFQVKYSKSPATKSERDSIEELIRTEAPKIANLRKHGLSRYFFVTNVEGTSHLMTGSVDRVNATLTELFEVPTFCLWRNDLDRRIDANSSIKWSYPEILRGTDVLQGLYEGRLGGDHERRLNAIRAYLAHQHKYDSQLKFKQVDLEMGLVDLFVDVPAAAVGPANPRERERWRERYTLSRAFAELIGNDHRRHAPDDENRIGAVRALVDAAVSAGLPRVVIEGAPGQGKSTVTQFLCQLHRMALLKKHNELSRVPHELKPTDVRLPLRVDLRDYATWLAGKSPFQDTNHEALGTHSYALESFLSAQISAQSGGLRFSPDDLLAFASSSALLIVLDGFDEVADTSTRNRLVREISDAATRFDGNAISSQVIVTSRPAAFANSPGFPKEDWQYVELLPLTKSAISTYTDKWSTGHNLDPKDRRDVVNVLEEKLEHAHVRDLARNPMQLAILLALISTQGASLPDKRTTLYDRYVDIFFNRESEKSKVVRDKRDLLIDIHRYLAWTLQVEAENDAKAGNITDSRLREVLRFYLNERGHDPSLVDVLFTGMVERVVALVSRVQGTFEFEVQPLREYFAARYLYDTAPYIQAGSARSGSIMDRFDALARNAYWLNVTRFYCGCYSSGELPSLVDGIIIVGQSDSISGTSYQSDIGLTLLGDYVFSQQPRSVNRLTEFLFEENRFRLLLAGLYDERGDSSIVLPEGNGRAKIVEAAAKHYLESRHFDTAYSAATLIKANATAAEKSEIWAQAKDSLPAASRLHFGSFLDVIDSEPAEDLLTMLELGGSKSLRICAYRDRLDVLALKPALWREFVELTLDGRGAWLGFPRRSSRPVGADERVVRIISTAIGGLSALIEDEEPRHGRTLSELALWYGGTHESDLDELTSEVVTDISSSWIDIRLQQAAALLVHTELERTESLERRISDFLGLLHDQFGLRMAIIDAAIASLRWFGRGPQVMKYHGILRTLADLRVASAQGGDWWVEWLSRDDGAEDVLKIKLFIAWANDEVFRTGLNAFSGAVDRLSSADFRNVFASRSGRHGPSPRSASERVSITLDEAGLNGISPRAAVLIYNALSADNRDAIFTRVLLNSADTLDEEDDVCEIRAQAAWHFAVRNPSYWPDALMIIADAYSRGVTVDHVPSPLRDDNFPALEARQVIQRSSEYPLSIVAAAEGVLAEKVGARVIPVGSVAVRDGWFSL